MTFTKIRRELKCKFPPCPCQKCSKFRGDNDSSINSTVNCCDTPPERPIPKHKFQCKCTCVPEIIVPNHERKCPSPTKSPTQRSRSSSEAERNCPEDHCNNTDKGCCNTVHNFVTFMINMIGFVAFVIIAAIVFWLWVIQRTVVLSFKVYNSNSTTQVAVASVISILFLLILYSAAMRSISRVFAKPKADKLPPARAPSPSTQKSPKNEATFSIFSINWCGTKESTKPSTSWLPSFRWGTAQKHAEVHFSWMSSFTWGRSKETEEKPETRSSWMPSLRWTKSKQKELKKPEPRSSWMSLIEWHQKEIEPPPKPSYWVTLFSWFHSTTKAAGNFPKKSEARTIWSPWTFDWGHCAAGDIKATYKKYSSSSWMPSFMRGQSAPKKKTPCKTVCNRSAGEMKKQKVTVTITDEEARQIFKESKLYAIPTEMKQPPTLIIYLRDLIQRNTD